MTYRPDNRAQRDLDDLHTDLGGKVVALRVDWAHRLKSIHAALVLQQLIFNGRLHADPDGWFYVTGEAMKQQTSVGERGYADARTKLEKLELIETEARGLPRRIWTRVNVPGVLRWSDEGSDLRRDLQSQQIAEQAPPKVDASPAKGGPRSRQMAEHSYESKHKKENNTNGSPLTSKEKRPPLTPGQLHRLDPVRDRDLILAGKVEPYPPDKSAMGTIMVWMDLAAEWRRRHDT